MTLNSEFLSIVASRLRQDVGPTGWWLTESGIDIRKLGDRSVIWKTLVNYFVQRRMQSTTIRDHWRRLPDTCLLFDIDRLVRCLETVAAAGSPCFRTPCIASNCGLSTRKLPTREWIRPVGGSCGEGIGCPVEVLTSELLWHPDHYVIAKGLCEVAWRILRPHGGDFNRYVAHALSGQGSLANATAFILKDFTAVKKFGPGKNIRHMLRDLTLPLFGMQHLRLDESQLVPIDIHVQRLLSRHGLQQQGETPGDAVCRLGPVVGLNAGDMTYLLFRFGAKFELGICEKNPDCARCKNWSPEVYAACAASERKAV
jgi:hypothetical protein